MTTEAKLFFSMILFILALGMTCALVVERMDTSAEVVKIERG